MATPWPADAAPWFCAGVGGGHRAVVSVVVVVLGMVALRVPDLVVLVLGGALTLTTARAAWSTFDVIRNGLWELIPVCIIALLAFGSAVTAAGRWRSAPDEKGGEGPGGVAAVVLAAWLVVVLVLLAGAAIASSARTHAFGDSQSPPQGLPGLLSVRAADAPVLDDLHGRWLAQLAAAQVTDDRAGLGVRRRLLRPRRPAAGAAGPRRRHRRPRARRHHLAHDDPAVVRLPDRRAELVRRGRAEAGRPASPG